MSIPVIIRRLELVSYPAMAETMNVSPTPELQRYIEDQVRSGRYQSASEVVRENLRLKQQVEELHTARLEALRHDLDTGLAELARGERIPGEEAVSDILATLNRDPER
jgi:antitoxin ParD1/3/4